MDQFVLMGTNKPETVMCSFVMEQIFVSSGYKLSPNFFLCGGEEEEKLISLSPTCRLGSQYLRR